MSTKIELVQQNRIKTEIRWNRK